MDVEGRFCASHPGGRVLSWRGSCSGEDLAVTRACWGDRGLEIWRMSGLGFMPEKTSGGNVERPFAHIC